jgi:N-acetylmuramoyl-L-alanine amidase
MDENAVITWDDITKTVQVSGEGLAIEVTLGAQYMIANGRYLYIPDGCFTVDGSAMAPVRQLAKAYGAQVAWDCATNTACVTSGGTAIESGDLFYNQDDLFWLSRIIFCESGAEVLDGQIGVGNVVLNRVQNPDYPDTVYDVVFDTRFGVQFSPIINGAIYRTPSELSEIAAKLVLDGARTVGDSLFFLNEAIATSTWICDNRSFVVTIGGHSFYA